MRRHTLFAMTFNLFKKKPSADFPDTQVSDLPVDDAESADGKPLRPLAFEHHKMTPREWLAKQRTPLVAGVIVLAAGAYFLLHTTKKAEPDVHIPNVTVLHPSAEKKDTPPKTVSHGVQSSGAASPQQNASKPMETASQPVDSTAAGHQDDLVRQIIHTASKGAATVLSITRGPAGLSAVTYKINGQQGLAWVDTAHGLVFLGTVLNSEGRNLASGLIAMQAMASGSTSNEGAAVQSADGSPPVALPQGVDRQAAAVLNAMRNAVTISSGEKGGVMSPVWIFADPDSARTAKFFQKNKALLKGARFKWIPVAYEDTNSMARVATILTQLSPLRALEQNFANFNFQGKQGGAEPSGAVATSMASISIKNTQMLSQVATLETPTVLFCDKSGAPHVMVDPPDFGALLQMTGPCAEVKKP